MIIVTAATGQLGRATIEELLRRGVPAGTIVAGARTPEKANELADRGIVVREIDFDRPETLTSGFADAERVLLISGNVPTARVAQHRAVVDAAKAVGVALLVYTSGLHADSMTVAMAADHLATEDYIRESGLTYSLLRNNLYNEVILGAVQTALSTGVLIGAAGTGRVSSAARTDYAAAAAAVLLDGGHDNSVYELTGDTSWSRQDLAAMVTALSGRSVEYRDVTVEEYAAALSRTGLPKPVADVLADNDSSIAAGAFEDYSGDLRRLIGRPTTPIGLTLSVALSEIV